MKKLICFILVLAMLCVAFAGCSEKTAEETMEDITNEASEATKTLSIWLMAEAEVSPEVEEQIEAAINTITKSKFKAKIDLRYFTDEEEYYTALNAAFDKAYEESMNFDYGSIEDWLEDDDDDEEEESETEEETVLNEFGLPELKYPDIPDHQVDIFYINGYDNFYYYNELGLLNDIGEYVKSLSDDIFPDFLSMMKKVGGGTYAVPTNRLVGDYTFLLLNKEALKDANYSASDFATVYDANCQDFLDIIAENYRDEYVPFYSEGNILENIPGVKYWGVDENYNFCQDFSVFGSTYTSSAKYGSTSAITYGRNVLSTATFKSHVNAIKGYEFNGYYATDAEKATDKDFAVGYVIGGADVFDTYGDEYEIITLATPFLTTELLFSDMFSVGIYTADLSRSMDVLNFMNTDDTIKNILLYGVEGVHYEFVDSKKYFDENGDPYKVVRRICDKEGNPLYLMDNAKTGNMFNAYTLEGEDPNWIKYAQRTNRDAAISLSMGFVFGYDGLPMSKEVFDDIKAISKDTYEGIMNAKTQEELDDFLKKQEFKVNNNRSVIDALTDNDPTGELGLECQTFSEIYRQWLSDTGLFVFESN